MIVEGLPLLEAKQYEAPSVFEPGNLLRESRRQRRLPDIVRHLFSSGRGRRHAGWACYHTEMWTITLDGSSSQWCVWRA